MCVRHTEVKQTWHTGSLSHNIDRVERKRRKESEKVTDRETHLQVSVVTDRLRVSSCVSASRVRHRWPGTRWALWVLQQLGNWRPHGYHVSNGLRWHIHKKMHTGLMPRKKRAFVVKHKKEDNNVNFFWLNRKYFTLQLISGWNLIEFLKCSWVTQADSCGRKASLPPQLFLLLLYM